MSRVALLAAVVLLFCALCAHGEDAEVSVASTVQGAKQNEQGVWEIEHENVTWLVLDGPEGKPYFVHKEKNVAQWEDPRAPVAAATTTKKPHSTATIVAVSLVPVFAFAAAMAGRIYYLQKYYPELLWPTKERKQRYRNNNKFRPTKTRGKMSQDGKGGRSANS